MASAPSTAASPSVTDSNVLERAIVKRFEARIQGLAEERVAAYAASPEFVALVEELKRKKREEMLARCVLGR